MKVFVIANAEQEKEMMLKSKSNDAELIFKNEFPPINEYADFAAFFILDNETDKINFENFGSKPVFINSVIETLSQLNLPDNISRINAWPGFLQREIWEVVSNKRNESEAVLKQLGWKTIFVKDEPGFIAARVISMIINEAFFALNEKVSTIEEIDQAMKLGTNYPYGPFEWTEKIGVENIFNLLKNLSEKDARYIPSAALEKLYSEIKEK